MRAKAEYWSMWVFEMRMTSIGGALEPSAMARAAASLSIKIGLGAPVSRNPISATGLRV